MNEQTILGILERSETTFGSRVTKELCEELLAERARCDAVVQTALLYMGEWEKWNGGEDNDLTASEKRLERAISKAIRP